MSLAAIIPARGGSVRIPRKNIAVFRGKPMLVRAIETAQAFGLFRLIIVSTDDSEIEDVALKSGAIVMRRNGQDDGTRGTQEIARSVLLQIPSISQACVIYPCTPLLTPGDLNRGLIALFGQHYAYSVDHVGQDAGAFYFVHAKAFIDEIPLTHRAVARVPLPPTRCCDINTPEDWSRAEKLYDALRRAP